MPLRRLPAMSKPGSNSKLLSPVRMAPQIHRVAKLIERGIAFHRQGKFNEAIACYDKVIKIKPDYAKAHLNRGIALRNLGSIEEAIVSYDNAIAIEPRLAQAHSSRGIALQILQQYDEALTSYQQAIAIKPDYAQAYSNRGNVLQELGRLEEAIASYSNAISIEPDYVDAKWNLSRCYLLTGNFKEGWPLYESRWKAGDAGLVHLRDFPQPLWLGEQSLQGKTILLYAEQGLGDTIQFCRYAFLVARLGATVILEVQAPLVQLLQNLEGVSLVLAQGDVLPPFDYQCPLLSLPLAFKTDLSTIVPIPQGLLGDPHQTSKWQAILGEQSKPRIGLVWSSVSNFKNDHLRSITLANLLTALPKEGFEYICLQKEIKDVDQETLKANPHIRYFGDKLHSFSDTANLIGCMDLVIGTCTSVPHLSGSLGKQTWLLLPFNPDWRWLLNREDSPWYPSVKLYRQDAVGDWGGVLKRIHSALLTL